MGINWIFKFDLVAAIFGGQGAFIAGCICSCWFKWINVHNSFISANEDVNQDFNYNKSTEINYGTEFGEETDIVDLRESFKSKLYI